MVRGAVWGKFGNVPRDICFADGRTLSGAALVIVRDVRANGRCKRIIGAGLEGMLHVVFT